MGISSRTGFFPFVLCGFDHHHLFYKTQGSNVRLNADSYWHSFLFLLEEEREVKTKRLKAEGGRFVEALIIEVIT